MLDREEPTIYPRPTWGERVGLRWNKVAGHRTGIVPCLEGTAYPADNRLLLLLRCFFRCGSEYLLSADKVSLEYQISPPNLSFDQSSLVAYKPQTCLPLPSKSVASLFSRCQLRRDKRSCWTFTAPCQLMLRRCAITIFETFTYRILTCAIL